MKNFKIDIYQNLLDDEPVKTFYVLVNDKTEANEIRYAFCKTFGCVGCVTEVDE